MSDPYMKRASLAAIREMKDSGELIHNVDAIEGESLGAEFWAKAEIRGPDRPRVRSVHLKLEPEVFEFFYKESSGKGHLTKMQNVLRSYFTAHRHDR